MSDESSSTGTAPDRVLAPGTSYAAQSFAMLDPSRPVPHAAQRLRWFVDGHSADAALRRALPVAMIERSGAMYALLCRAHVDGWEPWATMYSTGHGEYWASVTAHLRALRDAEVAAMQSQ